MRSTRTLFALIFLFLSLELGVADRYPIQKRAGSSLPALTTLSVSASPTNFPSQSGASSKDGRSTVVDSTTADSSLTADKSTSLSATSLSSTQTSSSQTSSVVSAATPSISIFNATLTPNDLPLPPELTPGFAVAGALLLVSGTVYALVGIRNKLLQIFFSAAYLVSLAVTVLVIYVMNPPVSNGLQGAYVVAVTLTGLILGGAALLLMEMTEGLGCLFGGFCLAMWLLVLQPGGLLTTTAPVVVFIVCFTLGGWATSFSHYTRPYGLICLTSFGGATVVMIGVDCFTKAGLKEFWAYIWNLNLNLFPLGATTYPLTKGMKVEIATIIVIFLVGMASQSKLWKIIKKRRERRELNRLHNERNLRQEEEKVGRQIEHTSTRQRVYWEPASGNKDSSPSADSGNGSIAKDAHESAVASTGHLSSQEIEMDEISPSPALIGAGPEQDAKGRESALVVRVLADEEQTPDMPSHQNSVSPNINQLSPQATRNSTEVEARHIDSSGDARLAGSSRNSNMDSQRTFAGPEIVPLPFKVLDGEGDNSSSVATFADDDNGSRFSKRFSQGSELLRSLSLRSQLKREALSRPNSTSTEKLVNAHAFEDDRSSVAATVDEMTDQGDAQSQPSLPEYVSAKGIPDQERSEQSAEDGNNEIPKANKASASVNSDKELQPQAPVEAMTPQSSIIQKSEKIEPENGENQDALPPLDLAIPESQPVALTKAVLPAALPRVASSYRTNEWAKHLSNADTPEAEEIKLVHYPTEVNMKLQETPAVVHVKDLQQTPDSAPIPPAQRKISQMPSSPVPPLMARTSSYQSLESSRADAVAVQISHTVQPIPQAVISRSASQQSLQGVTAQPMHPTWSYRNSSSPNIGQTLVESPVEDKLEAFPTGTLMGKRETMLRNKSALGFNPLTAAPEAVLRASPDIRAGKIRDSRLFDGDNGSARRSVIWQSSLTNLTAQVGQNSTFDSHQPRRQSSTPITGPSREIQLAQWRASVQQDLHANVQPKKSLDKMRSALLQEKMISGRQKEMEQARKGMIENEIDERMRKGDMLEAHKEAMRRMQKEANKHT